jgi:tetratricopeptide (TPR) repeat protein
MRLQGMLSHSFKFHRRHFNLGVCSQKLGDLEAAETLFRRLIALKPNLASAYNNLGTIKQSAGNAEGAIKHYRKAITLAPEFAEAHNNLGTAYKAQGEIENARDAFGTAVNLNPNYIEVFRNFVISKQPALRKDNIESLENLFKVLTTTSNEKSHIYFTLGQVHDEINETDIAFEHFLEGNRLARTNLTYSAETHEHYIYAVMSTFLNSFLAGWDSVGVQGNTPIFVVGLPRSGTTLIEQILATHSSNIANEHLIQLNKVSQGAARTTDKMPFNFRFLGLIKMILPNAKVVHCIRSPEATCVLILKQLFNESQNFAYDLVELGRYYND